MLAGAKRVEGGGFRAVGPQAPQWHDAVHDVSDKQGAIKKEEGCLTSWLYGG